jgi:hypothetical protein
MPSSSGSTPRDISSLPGGPLEKKASREELEPYREQYPELEELLDDGGTEPITRELYRDILTLGWPPDHPWTSEDEAQLPPPLRDYDELMRELADLESEETDEESEEE